MTREEFENLATGTPGSAVTRVVDGYKPADVAYRYIKPLDMDPGLIYKWIELDDNRRTLREGVCDPSCVPKAVREAAKAADARWRGAYTEWLLTS